MTDADLLAKFDRAAAACRAVVAAIRPSQLGDPTPCTEWTVQQLLNHLVGGTKAFRSLQTGEPMIDRQADHLGGRINEMMVHGWDLAAATGQPTNLDPELAEECIESFRQLRASGHGQGLFAQAQPAPDEASAADRLAAIAGRNPAPAR
jgi:Mycothiol maleylpyruvate isomerase N-terminal domain